MAHSNAWNVSSLLIKPVQRFTKYPLLLAAIVDATSEEHPDYQGLISAKSLMLDAVKKVNEDSRRRDVVHAVLEGKGLKGVVATVAPAAATLATAGSVGRIKTLRSGFSVGRKDKDKAAGEEDTAANGPNGAISPGLNGSFDDTANGADKTPGGALDDLHKRLKEFDTMIPKYTTEVLLWVKSVRETLVRLENWALAFEKVIALSDEGGIEALQAFRNVLADRLTGVIDALVSIGLND
jgi:ribosomal protein L12E/L44/L45/RPP1/RPP2